MFSLFVLPTHVHGWPFPLSVKASLFDITGKGNLPYTLLARMIYNFFLTGLRFSRSMTAAVQSILVMSIPEGAWHK